MNKMGFCDSAQAYWFLLSTGFADHWFKIHDMMQIKSCHNEEPNTLV